MCRRHFLLALIPVDHFFGKFVGSHAQLGWEVTGSVWPRFFVGFWLRASKWLSGNWSATTHTIVLSRISRFDRRGKRSEDASENRFRILVQQQSSTYWTASFWLLHPCYWQLLLANLAIIKPRAKTKKNIFFENNCQNCDKTASQATSSVIKYPWDTTWPTTWGSS